MKSLVKNLRKNQTEAERKMWRHLKSRALAGYKFRRQCLIGPYIADFVCFEKMIVIEIDGGQHADRLQRDLRRTQYLESRNFKVIRFWNNEVLTNTDSVLSAILATLINSPSSPTLLPLGEGSKAIKPRPEFKTHAVEE
jgi:very-short-patch-repair endonuclease